MSQLVPGQFPDLTFNRCQEEESRDCTAEPRRLFTLRNLFVALALAGAAVLVKDLGTH